MHLPKWRKRSERLQKRPSFVCIYVTKRWVFGTNGRQKCCLMKTKPGKGGLRTRRSSSRTLRIGNRCAPSSPAQRIAQQPLFTRTSHNAARPLHPHSALRSKPSSPAQRTTQRPLLYICIRADRLWLATRLAIARLFVCHLRLFC